MFDDLGIVLAYVRQTLKISEDPPTQDISVEGVRIAREHGLSGLIYPSLNNPAITQKTKLYFNQEFVHYVQKDEIQKQTMVALRSLFNRHQVNFIFLKGAHLKSLYPQTYDRTMGDIDILIKPDEINKVDRILFEAGYDNYSKSTQHYNYRKGPEVEFEVHPGINYELPDSYQPFLSTLWNRVIAFKEFEYHLKVEDELIFLLMHLAKHFQSTGVGLRSLLDIGIFIEHYKEVLDLGYVNTVLQEAHLQRFASSIEMLCHRYFGLPRNPLFIVETDWNEKDIEFLTSYFLQSGIHGKHPGFNNFVSGIAKYSLTKESIRKGRFQFLLDHIFPSVSHLQGRYSYLSKAPWLLPFAWISRWLRILIMQPRRTLVQIKKLKVADSTIQTTLDIFHKLGL